MSETTPPTDHEDWKAWMHGRMTDVEAWIKRAKYPWSQENTTPSKEKTNES